MLVRRCVAKKLGTYPFSHSLRTKQCQNVFMDNRLNTRFFYGLLALLINTLACSPVIAISWNEFLIIAVVIIVLLGPPLYRFMRRLERFLKHEKKK